MDIGVNYAEISFMIPTPGFKGLPATNTLAYFDLFASDEDKSFIKLSPGDTLVRT